MSTITTDALRMDYALSLYKVIIDAFTVLQNKKLKPTQAALL